MTVKNYFNFPLLEKSFGRLFLQKSLMDFEHFAHKDKKRFTKGSES